MSNHTTVQMRNCYDPASSAKLWTEGGSEEHVGPGASWSGCLGDPSAQCLELQNVLELLLQRQSSSDNQAKSSMSAYSYFVTMMLQ